MYFCTKGVHQGIRFFYLVREGLLLHPSVQMLPFSRIHEADLVVYLPGVHCPPFLHPAVTFARVESVAQDRVHQH